MTAISENDQYEVDFDWFCVDEVGEIGHFTTAGFKRLPQSVERSLEDLNVFKRFFKKELKVGRGYQRDADLSREIPTSKHGIEQYLRDFVSMADKGLNSFDIDTYLSPGSYYFRVAVPILPLHFEELPFPVRNIVGLT